MISWYVFCREFIATMTTFIQLPRIDENGNQSCLKEHSMAFEDCLDNFISERLNCTLFWTDQKGL